MSQANITADQEKAWTRISVRLIAAAREDSPDKFLRLLKMHRVGLAGGMPVDFGPQSSEPESSAVSTNTLLFEISSIKKPAALLMVKALIELGADVNVMSQAGHRPLMAAASCKSVDMVRLLLEQGADVHARAGSTQMGESSVVGQFLDSYPSSEDGHILSDLLTHGASLKDLGTKRSALEMAIDHNSPERVRILLSHGEFPLEPYDPADSNSIGALTYAKQIGCTELVSIMQAWLDAQAASQAIGAIIAGAPGLRETSRTSP